MLKLDKNAYPRLEEDKIDLAIFSPVKSGTGRGNPFHDEATGKFTWAPPGNRIAKGAGLIKNSLTPSTRKMLFQRAKAVKSDTIAARIINGKLHIVLLRHNKRVDSFAVDPIGVRGKQQGPPQSNERSGEPVGEFTDEQRDIIFQVARNVSLQDEAAFRQIEDQLQTELTPDQKAQIKEIILEERIRLLVAYLDLRFRQTIKGETISDSEFRVKVGRGMLKKTVAGLGEDQMRRVVQRLQGLGWEGKDIQEKFINGLPARLKDKPLL
jgi:hypothetical protein